MKDPQPYDVAVSVGKDRHAIQFDQFFIQQIWLQEKLRAGPVLEIQSCLRALTPVAPTGSYRRHVFARKAVVIAKEIDSRNQYQNDSERR